MSSQIIKKNRGLKSRPACSASYLGVWFIIVLLMLLIPLIPNEVSAQSNRIEIAGKPLFVSGGNVAWIDFARDIGPGQTKLHLFEEIFREMNAHGGNSFRLWLHTNGVSTPEFSGTGIDAMVVGPGQGAIRDLRNILDLAHKYDISMKLCLWSFDMLQSGLSNDILVRNRALFTDDEKLNAYINNALIPMVDSLRGHPAIMAWEIFNEPEGMTTNFGWTPAGFRVTMNHIQKFVNRTVGAIKRTDPDVLVTNGSWSFRASSDKSLRGTVFTNYYRDDRLIAAGGDSLGVLDFYSVHYYKHFMTEQSPFHHDASYWGLDKPIVIGEFYLSDPRRDNNPDAIFGVPWQQLYETLYDRGYAGAMGWQWFDWYADRTDIDGVNGTENWPRMLENMRTMADKYPDDVILEFPGLRINFDSDHDELEKGQSTLLRWNTRGGTSATLNNEPVPPQHSILVSPEVTTTYVLSITDGDEVLSKSLTIVVNEPLSIDRLLNRQVTSNDPSSSIERVNDGDITTIWQTTLDGNVELSIDMIYTIDLHELTIHWSSDQPPYISFEGSYDGFQWEQIEDSWQTETSVTTIQWTDYPSARFIRISFNNTQGRAAIAGISARGVQSSVQAPSIWVQSPMSTDYLEEGYDVPLSINTSPHDMDIHEVTYYVNELTLGSVTTYPFEYLWNDIPPGEFNIRARVVIGPFDLITPIVTVTAHPQQESVRFEAELAALTGNTTVQEHPSASGGRYVRMQDASGSSLAWNNIDIPESDTYTLRFGFRLPFDSPKGQYLVVNGTQVAEIMFQGSLNQWLFTDLDVPLVQGHNSIRLNGSWGWMDFDFLEVRGRNLGTSIDHTDGKMKFTLEQNYPNPFNPTTLIRYQLAQDSHTRLTVFDVLGRQVAVLVDGFRPAGTHSVQFNAKQDLASGMYLYRIEADEYLSTRKMMLVK